MALLTTDAITANDIIRLALRECGAIGVGQTPMAEDTNDAFLKLNMMIAQWNRRRWMIYHLVNLGWVADGNQTFTIGPGGDINVPQRPDRIESAFFRQLIPVSPLQVDYQLKIIDNWEDYSKITLKTLTSFEQYLFYDPTYPLGTAYPWPIPTAGMYETFVNIKDSLLQFSSPTQQVLLPGEYAAALFYNLAMRLFPGYGLPVNPATALLAKDSIEVVKKGSIAVPRLSMPTSLVRPGIYSPYSDQIT